MTAPCGGQQEIDERVGARVGVGLGVGVEVGDHRVDRSGAYVPKATATCVPSGSRRTSQLADADADADGGESAEQSTAATMKGTAAKRGGARDEHGRARS
jgi:hypothetical protein